MMASLFAEREAAEREAPERSGVSRCDTWAPRRGSQAVERGSLVVVPGLSCSTARAIFPDRGLN